MKYTLLTAIVLLALMATAFCGTAGAWERGRTSRRPLPSWNSGYYNVGWGMPVAVVVPPTAEHETNWGWGVGNTRVTRIRHQFERDWPGPGQYNRANFLPTPLWPSDTRQFGYNYVRGPW